MQVVVSLPMQLKTTDLAASDLNKYHKALERALLAFHTGTIGLKTSVE
jgi:hypothetical protein